MKKALYSGKVREKTAQVKKDGFKPKKSGGFS